jgi:hypothetical protein
MLCFGCPKFDSKPTEISDELDAEYIADIVEQIEFLADWEDAGLKTDWSEYPFEICELFVEWRSTERKIVELRQRRLDMVLKDNFFK